jgi:hypothetical protein
MPPRALHSIRNASSFFHWFENILEFYINHGVVHFKIVARRLPQYFSRSQQLVCPAPAYTLPLPPKN